jgi:hypothetical protein
MKITLGEIYKKTRSMTELEKLKFFYEHFPEDQARVLTTILVVQPKIRKVRGSGRYE